jgi:hypothetical protein
MPGKVVSPQPQVQRNGRSWRDWVLAVLGTTSAGRARIFARIYRLNRWGSPASVSGVGSSLEQTAGIRRELPALFARHQIRTLADAPCGDLSWIRHVTGLELDRYIGIDIVAELIKSLACEPPIPNAEFRQLDVVSDPLPPADCILCRDLLVHLSNQQVYRCLRNFRASGSKYLLTTTFPQQTNEDTITGRWRPLNLEAPPFSFPPPLAVILEGNTQRNIRRGTNQEDKSLALWRLADLPLE